MIDERLGVGTSAASSWPEKPEYVYVASSWANLLQPVVCATLRAAGIDHYDFKRPSPDQRGFHWSEVMPSYEKVDRKPGQAEALAKDTEYLEALQHPAAEAGFERDWNAMQRADLFILVLPCGRSAHLELGWAVGAGCNTAILLDGGANLGGLVVPELMYKMVDYIAPSLFDLLGWLGVED